MILKEAVNQILTKLGENPVDSVDVKHPTVSLALQHLETANKELQQPGLWFNSFEVELQPDYRGIIKVPVGTIKWTTKQNKTHLRGDIVVNSVTQDKVWDKPLKGRILELVPFEDTPYSFQNWVVKEAILRAYLADYGVEDIVQLMQADVYKAQQMCHKEHLENVRLSTRNTRLGRKLYYWRDA
ncbi:MAG: hypothetical protein ACRC9P_01455 [Bacteroides sp.]